MHSVRYNYRCVCGRTYSEKLYVFDGAKQAPLTTDSSTQIGNRSVDSSCNTSKIWQNDLPLDDRRSTLSGGRLESEGIPNGNHTDDVINNNGNHTGDVIPNGNHPHGVTSNGNHTHDVTSNGIHSHDVTCNGIQTDDVTSNGNHPYDVTFNGNHPHDVTSNGIQTDDDTISNVKDASVENQAMPISSESTWSSHNPGEEGDNSLDSMTSLVLQLRADKEELSKKVSSSQDCLVYLKQENNRLAQHINDMVGLEGHSEDQTDTSCTDTEKELEQLKRQCVFLNQELKVLRQDNHRIREFGSLALDEIRNNPLNEVKNKSGETTGEIVLQHENGDGYGVTSLDHRKQPTEINGCDINHNEKDTLDENDAHRLDYANGQILSYQTTISNIHNGVAGLKAECETLRESHTTLKDSAVTLSKAMTDMMADTNLKVQQALSSICSQNDKVTQKYIREMKLRKQLQNQLVELKGNIRVFCRIRPSTKEDNPLNDSGLGEATMVVFPDIVDDGLVYIDNKGRQMEFDMDKVFGMGSSQQDLFDEVSPLVRSALDGFNVCIFAYGQTGSGKTYTMEGPQRDLGINQRALQLLFEDRPHDGWTYDVTASVLEIYNETIRDLLNPEDSNKLEVKLKPEGGLHVPGIVVVPVTSLEEVNSVLEKGREHRCTATTSMNDASSRSHCLLCIQINGRHQDTGVTTTGRLNLVDLAGSERVGRSQADGVRLKEAQNINRSLACLGDVIHALRSKQGHVPYRNSKLTYLLQDSLGGDSKTLMIVQVSPADSNVGETVCTLNFGQRVRSVEIGQASRNAQRPNSKRPANLHLHPNSPTTPVRSPSSLSPFPSPSPSPLSNPSTPVFLPTTTSTSSPSSPSHLQSSSSPSRTRRVATLSSSSSSSQTSSPSSPSSIRRVASASSSPSSPSSIRRIASASSSASSPSPSRLRKFTTSSSSPSSSQSSSSQTSASSLSPSRSRKFATTSTSPSSPQPQPHTPSSLSPSRLRKFARTSASQSSTQPQPLPLPQSPSSLSPSRLRKFATTISTSSPTSTPSSSQSPSRIRRRPTSPSTTTTTTKSSSLSPSPSTATPSSSQSPSRIRRLPTPSTPTTIKSSSLSPSPSTATPSSSQSPSRIRRRPTSPSTATTTKSSSLSSSPSTATPSSSQSPSRIRRLPTPPSTTTTTKSSSLSPSPSTATPKSSSLSPPSSSPCNSPSIHRKTLPRSFSTPTKASLARTAGPKTPDTPPTPNSSRLPLQTHSSYLRPKSAASSSDSSRQSQSFFS